MHSKFARKTIRGLPGELFEQRLQLGFGRSFADAGAQDDRRSIVLPTRCIQAER